MSYQYKIVSLPLVANTASDTLNEYARQGWRVIGCFPEEGGEPPGMLFVGFLLERGSEPYAMPPSGDL